MARYCRITRIYSACITLIVLTIAAGLLQLTTISMTPDIWNAKDSFFGKFQYTPVKQIEEKEKLPFVKIQYSRVYMYSAIVVSRNINQTQKTSVKKNSIVIPGWEYVNNARTSFTCCYMLYNGNVQPVLSSHKMHWKYPGEVTLEAKQFICPVKHAVSAIKGISLTIRNSTCPNENKYYLVPTLLNTRTNDTKPNRSKIAVCAKLAYGSLDARRLVEWFEVHRLFGVDKVMTYTYQLNPMAVNVLNYYAKLGIAQVFEFDQPEKNITKREVGTKSAQSWNDEQVVLFDCQERLRNYDYVAIVDTDEYIVPNTKILKNAWRTLLDKHLRISRLAGLLFRVSVHIDSWGPSDVDHPLYIGRYNNCTLPMLDRVKGVYMPSRVQPSSVSTHSFRPMYGYGRYTIPGELATMHHFRGCRQDWLRPRLEKAIRDRKDLFYMKNYTNCYDLRRFPSTIVAHVANSVTDSVLKIIKLIGI